MKPAKRSSLPLVAAGVAVAVVAAGGFFGYQWWSARSRTEVAATRQIPFSPGAEALPPAPTEPPPAVAETPVAPVAQPRTVKDASPVRATPPAKPVSTPSSPPPAASVPAVVPAPVTPVQQPEPKPSTVTPPPVAQVQAPVTQAQPAAPPAAQPEAPRRTEILRPEREFPAPSQARPAPGYSGPGAGVIVWSGQLEKGEAISVNGTRPSTGNLTGALPGVPVLIEVEPKDVGIAEAPGPSNGWKGFSLRSRKGRQTVVTIRWRVL